MSIISAYQQVAPTGSRRRVVRYDCKAVNLRRRTFEAEQAGLTPAARTVRRHNFEDVAALMAEKVAALKGRITAKRLLPIARAAGYTGSDRNSRRLVAAAKKDWRGEHHRGCRQGSGLRVSTWSSTGASSAVSTSSSPFLRGRGGGSYGFAVDEKAATTFDDAGGLLRPAGSAPKVVLADRMGCLKAGVVANRVVPTPDDARFATHYRFRPDFCEAADPESKGMAETLHPDIWVGQGRPAAAAPARTGTRPGCDDRQRGCRRVV